MDSFAPKQTFTELITGLHNKFGKCLEGLSPASLKLFDEIEQKCRVVGELRSTVFAEAESRHAHCAEIFDEVFADFSVAMYLLAAGLIVPARMAVRRALELGVAAIYLSDMPHRYWGWRKHDEDLSFTEMVTHISSSSYESYIQNLHQLAAPKKLCDPKRLQAYYRDLSNTVHGKYDGLAPLSPDRFSGDDKNLRPHLEITLEVQKAVLDLIKNRFPTRA